MNQSFNLLNEPWMPCIDNKNKLIRLNLEETVLQAHQLKELRSDLPIITGALYLFLIAYVMNILKIESEESWMKLWERGYFPNAYLSSYNQRWGDRFDLLDPVHPFYQDPKIGEREKDIQNLKKGKSPEPKGLSGLLLHLASGNNATLFDHSLDDLPKEYSFSEAAQLLIMLQAYSLGGMSSASIAKDRYYKDSAFGRGILFLNKGKNLFETLILNIPSENFTPLLNSKDCPSWEKDDAFHQELHAPVGILDLLTWQSRRIRLMPEQFGNKWVVKNIHTAPGHGIVDTYSNPFYHNRITTNGKEQTIKPLRFQEGHALWRDSTAILNIHKKDTEPPLPVKWSANIESLGRLKRGRIQLDLFGICTQPGQKKAYFYAHETFFAPTAYLQDPNLLEELEMGLNWAEDVRKVLYLAVRELARFKVVPMHDLENMRMPGRDDTDPLMQHWNVEYLYWSRLESAFFEYLMSLPTQENAHDEWEKAIRRSARDALAYAAEQVGTDPAGLKARAKAERSLKILLHRTFHPEGKE